MAVREVLRYPHPALKAVADPAPVPAERAAGQAPSSGAALDLPSGSPPAHPPPGAADTARVARDLLDTMRSFGHCVGLAATQLGELTRIVAVDVAEHPKAESAHGLLLLANPRVVAADGAEVGREGCLSVPHLTANVRRATRVELEAVALDPDPDGAELATRPLAVESTGFEARCLLHELDHLDGILFLDRVDSLTRDVFRRKRYG